MLNNEQITKYVKNQGTRCPYCDSDQLDGEDMNWDIPLCQSISCIDCGKSWQDVLTITGIVEE